MALDLSTVSEPHFDATVTIGSGQFALLSTDMIVLPGSNDVLFRVTDVGHLVLANYSMELRHGVGYLFKKSGSSTEEHETAVMVDKLLSMDRTSPAPGTHSCSQANKHSTSPRPNSEADWFPSDTLDSTGRFGPTGTMSTTTATITPSKSNLTVQPMVTDYPFLNEEEQPLDATLPRQRSVMDNNSPIRGSTGSSPRRETNDSEEDEPMSILSQYVHRLLQEYDRTPVEKEEESSTESLPDLVLAGHNISKLARFTKRLNRFRLQIELSQAQLSNELTEHFNKEIVFSQSLLSRFGRLEVTVRSAFRLLPYLERWLSHAEQRGCAASSTPSIYRLSNKQTPPCARGNRKVHREQLVRPGTLTGLSSRGLDNLPSYWHPPGDMDELPPSIKLCVDTESPDANTHIRHPPKSEQSAHVNADSRPSIDSNEDTTDNNPACQLDDPELRFHRRKRTHFSDTAVSILTAAYRNNPRPKGIQLTRLATETGHNRDTIRMWFCNRRQLIARIQTQDKSPDVP